MILLLVGGLLLGLWVRGAAWEATTPIRFRADIDNGLRWGMNVVSEAHAIADVPLDRPADLPWSAFFEAYVGTYDRVVEQADGRRVRLDYAPLRLLVMSVWAKQVTLDDRWVVPEDRWWRRMRRRVSPYDDWQAAGLLRFNTLVGLASATIAFVVVRRWTGSGIAAAVAAVALWLNAALVINAHAWPQWDGWLLPFWLAAFGLASTGRTWGWGLAGACIAVGAMLKGQILLAAPMLPVWALASGQWRGLLAVFLAFLGGVAAVTWPWVWDGPKAAVITVALASVVLLPRRTTWTARLGWALLLAGPAVVLAGVLGNGSFTWLAVGVAGPTEQYPRMTMGPVVNLPAILDRDFDFDRDTPVGNWTIRQLLNLAALACCVLAGIAAARLWKRRDTRLLWLTALPFLTAYALLPQMHERYLLWAAACSALAVAWDLRAAVLHVALTVISTLMMLTAMVGVNHDAAPGWRAFLDHFRPGLGWAVLALALWALAESLSSGRGRERGAFRGSPDRGDAEQTDARLRGD